MSGEPPWFTNLPTRNEMGGPQQMVICKEDVEQAERTQLRDAAALAVLPVLIKAAFDIDKVAVDEICPLACAKNAYSFAEAFCVERDLRVSGARREEDGDS